MEVTALCGPLAPRQAIHTCPCSSHLLPWGSPRAERQLRFRFRKVSHRGGLGVGWASDFGPGHDLIVREFEPCLGLCADGSEPGAGFGFCVSSSLCPSHVHALSRSVSQ